MAHKTDKQEVHRLPVLARHWDSDHYRLTLAKKTSLSWMTPKGHMLGCPEKKPTKVKGMTT